MLVDLETLLREQDIQPSERLGQHFLIDAGVIERLGQTVIPGACVVEVGAGPGNLTKDLTARASRVTAIEIDNRYQPLLEKIQNEHPNVDILFGNILDYNLHHLLYERGLNQVVANLPFHISEPMLWMLIDVPIESAILMIGDSLAQQIRESDRGNAYGRMSLLAQTFFDTQSLFRVPKDKFYPRPRTGSEVIELKPKEEREILANPASHIFARLFKTARHHGLVVNEIKEALVEASSIAFRGTLGRRESWQKERASFRRKAKEIARETNARGKYRESEDVDLNQGQITQSQAARLIERMGIDSSLLRKPFLSLDNQDIRNLVRGVKSVVG